MRNATSAATQLPLSGTALIKGGAVIISLVGIAIWLILASNSWPDTHYIRHGLIGAAVIAVLAFFVVWRHRAAQDRAAVKAFQHIHGDSTVPALMTDQLGTLLVTNRAWEGLGASHSTQRTMRRSNVTEILSRLAPDGAALAYRLMRQVELTTKPAAEIFAPHGDTVNQGSILRISPAQNAKLIWTLDSVPPSMSGVFSNPALGFALYRGTGVLVDQNPAFAGLSSAEKTTLADACAAAGTDAETITGFTLSENRPVLAHFDKVAADGSRFIMFMDMAATVTSTPDLPSLIDDLPIAIATLSLDGMLINMNAEAQHLLGPAAKPGDYLADLTEGLGRPMPERLAEASVRHSGGRADLARRRDKSREVYLRIALKRVDSGPSAKLIAVINDATEMETRERQFVQSQKMEAVGQLAGGVAHDFNNLLTAILGHCDLIALRQSQTDPDFDDLMQIRQNANRAAGLVRQLLAFSRQQKLNPTATNLRDALADLSHLLNRLIGERITLQVHCAEQLWSVWIDQQQIDQVIMNLVVNARDAMKGGGQIRIDCENQTIATEMRRDRAVVPAGDYVAITVKDQGCGMSETVRSQVFEPFFTTKKVGEGTGLGLSTAYGIIKQTGGFIFIDSEHGAGTVFTILLPRLRDDVKVSAKRSGPEAKHVDLTGAGKILLVEDEAPVRSFAARALRLRGYEVTEAEHAEAALTILANRNKSFDLVISDVVMPGLDGPGWVREARKSYPDLGVIFTSGYSEDVFRSGLKDLDDCSFLAKPFSLDSLTAAVKNRLTVAPEPASTT